MKENKYFIAAMSIAVILSFTVFAIPSWAASKEDIKIRFFRI